MSKQDTKPKKPEKRKPYQLALQRLREVNRENDYILAKGDTVKMQEVRYWTLGDYFAALEQILKDKDRSEQQQKQVKK